MSHEVEIQNNADPPSSRSGLDTLRDRSELRGPVGDHDHGNDHVALLYDDRDEQLAAAAAFLEAGLDAGERCLYVADDNDEADVVAALRAQGVDVDAARAAGALSIHSPAETYHRTGEFDRDAMLAFWEDALAEATEEDGFAGIRAAAEMTWALEDATSAEDLVEYEAVLNDLYDGEEYVVCCQYNTERFPASVLRDVVKTHPHVIEGDVVHDNVYYEPPEEFFEPESPESELERMIDGLRERTRSKTGLRRAKARFQNIFERSHDAILVVDPATDAILDANPAAAEMLAYPRSELLDVAPSELHPDELDQFHAFLESVFAEGAGWTDQLTCRTRDGDALPVEISASTMEYDDRRAVLAVVRDVSDRIERDRAQRRLYEIAADTDRSFEEKLQALIELGCERFDLDVGGLARVDHDTDRFEVETTNVEHDHLTPGQVYPLSETYCREAVADGDVAAVEDPNLAVYEDKLCYEQFGVRTYFGTYLEIDGGDDRTFWFLSDDLREQPFTDAERTFLHLMGEWVKYELQRQRHEADLEETVRRLTQSNDRLTQFAYAASHDLQEPLRMISSYLQLLEREHADALDEEARECVDFAVDGADRMRSMVEDLLAYSRIEQCDDESALVDCDVIADRVTDDLQVQIEERDATVEVEELPTIEADPEQVEQLFRNLVSNAVKYGGESPTVEFRAADRGDRWAFVVADDGIGIDPERTDRIFEVFKRLHHQDEYSGTGIGLALCQEIVERHGGEIQVESEPGEGSTFTVTLPKRQDR